MRYLTLLDVIAVHERVMRATGFAPRPLVRPEVLEGALFRPQQAAYYEGADLFRQAALLAVAVAEAQAFEDGNKTTAFACLDLFLRDNGYKLIENQRTIADALIAFATNRAGRDALIDRIEGDAREGCTPTIEPE